MPKRLDQRTAAPAKNENITGAGVAAQERYSNAGYLLLGLVIERFAYRPLREARAPRIAPLISALGVSFCLKKLAPIFFGTDYKVLRGGSWATRPGAIRSTFRNWDYPIRRQIFSGFRCARDA